MAETIKFEIKNPEELYESLKGRVTNLTESGVIKYSEGGVALVLNSMNNPSVLSLTGINEGHIYRFSGNLKGLGDQL